MHETVYVLCAVTAATCAVLLLRAYRRHRTRPLLWSSLCSVQLALNNTLLFVDSIVVSTGIDLSLWRGAISLAGVGFALFGAAFWVLAVHWFPLPSVRVVDETRTSSTPFAGSDFSS